MKILIASDLHGSKFYAEKLIERFKEENAEKLFLLGDVYNHGPRNPLPKDYSPMNVAEILNTIKDKLFVIKGNCDSEVDKMISEFTFTENAVIFVDGKSLYLTHGHVFNKDKMPSTRFDAVIYGHFHTGFIERENGVVIANAGSLSLPKGGTENSYLIYQDGKLYLKDIYGKVLNSILLG